MDQHFVIGGTGNCTAFFNAAIRITLPVLLNPKYGTPVLTPGVRSSDEAKQKSPADALRTHLIYHDRNQWLLRFFWRGLLRYNPEAILYTTDDGVVLLLKFCGVCGKRANNAGGLPVAILQQGCGPCIVSTGSKVLHPSTTNFFIYSPGKLSY
ncbi:hypothetical protein MKQ68_13090 [Chitinophaga horti]|uniref:Uncharacterized protein n=1 Tax=Chitinophaga horti TaxID=2920382 RepID=A0ABY6IYE3_9BACT|nr:hypothetical protein [Chitinophaga horti]UYQ91029.1 hypothetical protein MKQ68_13090 [Chitinophaga horti]